MIWEEKKVDDSIVEGVFKEAPKFGRRSSKQ